MLAAFFQAVPSHPLNFASGRAVWENLVEEAFAEYLLPGVAERLRILGIEGELPPDLLQVFHSIEQLNAERNQSMLAEAINVATLLNQVGLKPTALKGLAYLLTGVYDNPGTRYLRDIDLLLPLEEVPSAISHLKRHGYLETESEPFIRFRHHYPGLQRPGCALVEIHHRVGQGVCARLLPTPAILADALPLSVEGASFLIPSPTNLANHLILHSQLHHPYHDRIFPSLRALTDLVRLQDRFGSQIDWLSIAKRYREEGEYGTLLLHLKHARQIVGFPMPQQSDLSTGKLSLLSKIRWQRRLLLNRAPKLRFFDPIYGLMSLFSRRLRLVPQILRSPSFWPKFARILADGAFYRNVFSVRP